MKSILLGACLAPLLGLSQTLTIKKIQVAGEKIIVSYSLEDSNPNNEYKVGLYASVDNFSKEATAVSGDAGDEVKPGVDRKLEWTITKDYGNYKGQLALELRAKVFVPFVKLQGFNPGKGFKRGSSQTLTWKPGSSDPINIQLYKGGQLISGETNHPNNGSSQLYVPSHAKPGGDYRIKFSSTKNMESVIFSPPFNVRPKFPLWMKVAPVVVIGGVIVLLSGGEKTPEESSGTRIANPPVLD